MSSRRGWLSASASESLLKEHVASAGSQLRNDLESRMSMTEFRQVEEAVLFIEEEEVIVRGELRTVRRLFIRPLGSTFQGVGWIINDDITSCMVCSTAFGFFRRPHHCRSCGNLVCSSCSSDKAIVYELKELGPVRVCQQCFWGQEVVHATFTHGSFVNGTNSSPFRSRTTSATLDEPIADEPMENFSESSEPMNVETQPIWSEAPVETPLRNHHLSMRLRPTPSFVIQSLRKPSFQQAGVLSLSPRNTRRMYVNVCTHPAILDLTGTPEFVISDNVWFCSAADPSTDAFRALVNALEDAQERSLGEDEDGVEMYHAVLRPDLLVSEHAELEERTEQLLQVSEILLEALEEKFHLETLSRTKATVRLPSISYFSWLVPGVKGAQSVEDPQVIGPVAEVSLPLFEQLASSFYTPPARELTYLYGQSEGRMNNFPSQSTSQTPSTTNTTQDATLAIVTTPMRSVTSEQGSMDVSVESLLSPDGRHITNPLRRTSVNEPVTSRSENDTIPESSPEPEVSVVLSEKVVVSLPDSGFTGNPLREAARVAAAVVEVDNVAADIVEVDTTEDIIPQVRRPSGVSQPADTVGVNPLRMQTPSSTIADELAFSNPMRISSPPATVTSEDTLVSEQVISEADDVPVVSTAADAGRKHLSVFMKNPLAIKRGSRVAATRSPSGANFGSVVEEISSTSQLLVSPLNCVPTPWIVLKSRLIEDNRKLFVNLTHSHELPTIDLQADSQIVEHLASHNFIHFRSSGVAYTMHVGAVREATDQEAILIDIAVPTALHLKLIDSQDLAHRLYIKVLRMLTERMDTPLDLEYKMPRTTRNYKGATDVISIVLPALYVNQVTPSASQAKTSSVLSSESTLVASSTVSSITTGADGMMSNPLRATRRTSL